MIDLFLPDIMCGVSPHDALCSTARNIQSIYKWTTRMHEVATYKTSMMTNVNVNEEIDVPNKNNLRIKVITSKSAPRLLNLGYFKKPKQGHSAVFGNQISKRRVASCPMCNKKKKIDDDLEREWEERW